MEVIIIGSSEQEKPSIEWLIEKAQRAGIALSLLQVEEIMKAISQLDNATGLTKNTTQDIIDIMAQTPFKIVREPEFILPTIKLAKLKEPVGPIGAISKKRKW